MWTKKKTRRITRSRGGLKWIRDFRERNEFRANGEKKTNTHPLSDGRRRSFLHVRNIEIRLNYTGNPLIEPADASFRGGLSCAGQARGLRKANENLRTDAGVDAAAMSFLPSVLLSFFPGVVGETQGYPSSHRGRRDVHVGPEIRRVAFSSHGGLDATSEIPSTTRFWHVRVSSVHDAAHRSLHAPLRRRLVLPLTPSSSFFTPGPGAEAVGTSRRADFTATRKFALYLFAAGGSLMCTARASRYTTRHLPRHGPADLLHDLIHVEPPQWDTRPKVFYPPPCLTPRSARASRSRYRWEFARKDQIVKQIRSGDRTFHEIDFLPVLRSVWGSFKL